MYHRPNSNAGGLVRPTLQGAANGTRTGVERPASAIQRCAGSVLAPYAAVRSATTSEGQSQIARRHARTDGRHQRGPTSERLSRSSKRCVAQHVQADCTPHPTVLTCCNIHLQCVCHAGTRHHFHSRYRLGHTIGSGGRVAQKRQAQLSSRASDPICRASGFSVVKAAVDRNLGRAVAVKVQAPVHCWL